MSIYDLSLALRATPLGEIAACYDHTKKQGEVMEKDLLRVLQACVGAVVLLATVLLIFGVFPSMKSEVGAAWVQAIGSIGAIVSAIWIMNRQHEAARKKEKKDRKIAERRFLISIKSEITLLLDGFEQTTGGVISRLEKGDTLTRVFEFSETPFAVYDHIVGDIGIVESDEIRSAIIEVYAKARGILVLIAMNNNLLRQRQMLIASNDFKNGSAVYTVEQNLLGMVNQLVDRYPDTIKCVERIKQLIP